MLLEAPPGDRAGLGGLHDLSWEHPTPPARTSTTLTVPHPPTSSSRGLSSPPSKESPSQVAPSQAVPLCSQLSAKCHLRDTITGPPLFPGKLYSHTPTTNEKFLAEV